MDQQDDLERESEVNLVGLQLKCEALQRALNVVTIEAAQAIVRLRRERLTLMEELARRNRADIGADEHPVEESGQ